MKNIFQKVKKHNSTPLLVFPCVNFITRNGASSLQSEEKTSVGTKQKLEKSKGKNIDSPNFSQYFYSLLTYLTPFTPICNHLTSLPNDYRISLPQPPKCHLSPSYDLFPSSLNGISLCLICFSFFLSYT